MIGETIGQYKITGHLGSGGMGEVFLAVDSKLDREVALKFLPTEMAADGDVKARFLQEARAASALNHPNLCTIYDVSDHEGRMFIVMEHIDGQTLREKKEHLSLSQVLEIGAQMADGLAAAHAKGIVHRDIKTENVMVRKDGIVQIMDFGLAKLRGVSRLTKEGSTLGTTGYMSPEQALGQDADHRTDIFSLGVVLFELLTGELPFHGAHEAAIMYEIVNVDSPPPSAMRPEIDTELDRIVLECLQKEPDERYQSAKEVAKDLRRFKRDSGRQRVSRISQVRPSMAAVPRVATAPHETIAPTAAPKKSPLNLAWAVAGLAIAAALVLAYLQFGGSSDVRGVIRSHILPPDGSDFVSHSGGHLALSPTGSHLAFVASDTSSTAEQLWIRPLNSFAALPLPGTEGATFPFWSPDGRHVAFFADNKLKKIQITGGPALTICDAQAGRNGSWNTDNVIIFTPTASEAIHRVSGAGGEPTPVTVLDSTLKDYTHRWAHFLPDQKHFLFFIRTGGGAGSDEDVIAASSLDGGEIKRLVHTKSNVAYANGHILYVREGTLLAHPFDPDNLELTGDAFPVVENISFTQGWSRSIFTLSTQGHLAYQTGDVESGSQMAFFDRAGVKIDSVKELLRYYEGALSPDETRLAVDVLDESAANVDVWIVDLERGIRTRFTFDSEGDYAPEWSPDGEMIAFVSERSTQPGLFIKPSDGTSEALNVYQGEGTILTDWSDDGRHLVFWIEDPATATDVWVLPLFGDSTARPVLNTEFNEIWGRLSPDGRWMAYTSDESGDEEVYVTTFPDAGPKWQVSTDGGDRPKWRADGQELFYVDDRDHIMVSSVDGSGSSFVVGKVVSLFGMNARRPGWLYEVSADGQRFVVNTNLTQSVVSPVTLVTNLDQELKNK